MKRSLLHALTMASSFSLLFVTLTCITSPVAAREPNAEPSVKVNADGEVIEAEDGIQLESADDAIFLPDKDTENDEDGSDLADDEETEKETQSTKEMAKEITNGSDEQPEPEFPYPGAKEEGFESRPQSASGGGSTPANVIRPIRMSANGEYFYGFNSSPKDATASMRFGLFSPPPDIVNPNSSDEQAITFESIYGDKPIPTILGDYEWSLSKAAGDLGLKVGSGLFIRQGKGVFAEPNDPLRVGRTPDEQYTFLMFPNTLSAIYKLRFSDTQWVTPYAEGGGGYFTFAELRDDNKIKVGAAPVIFGAGGLNFNLDWVDPGSVRELDLEWGINHVSLMFEYRLIVGLNKTFDFSANLINAGVMMEF